MKQGFEYRHVVHLEETNLSGNVYFTRYLSWQGVCREEFLRLKAPGVLEEIRHDLRLLTAQCTCSYFAQLTAFDVVSVRLYLKELWPNRMRLLFKYTRELPEPTIPVAVGEQEIVAMRNTDESMEPCRLPRELVEALRPYELGAVVGTRT